CGTTRFPPAAYPAQAQVATMEESSCLSSSLPNLESSPSSARLLLLARPSTLHCQNWRSSPFSQPTQLLPRRYSISPAIHPAPARHSQSVSFQDQIETDGAVNGRSRRRSGGSCVPVSSNRIKRTSQAALQQKP